MLVVTIGVFSSSLSRLLAWISCPSGTEKKQSREKAEQGFARISLSMRKQATMPRTLVLSPGVSTLCLFSLPGSDLVGFFVSSICFSACCSWRFGVPDARLPPCCKDSGVHRCFSLSVALLHWPCKSSARPRSRATRTRSGRWLTSIASLPVSGKPRLMPDT